MGQPGREQQPTLARRPLGLSCSPDLAFAGRTGAPDYPPPCKAPQAGDLQHAIHAVAVVPVEGRQGLGDLLHAVIAAGHLAGGLRCRPPPRPRRAVGEDLGNMAELLDVLEPLTS